MVVRASACGAMPGRARQMLALCPTAIAVMMTATCRGNRASPSEPAAAPLQPLQARERWVSYGNSGMRFVAKTVSGDFLYAAKLTYASALAQCRK